MQAVCDIESLGVRAAAVNANLREPASIREAVAQVAAEFGSIDILVNNAGRFETAAIENISVDQWDAMFETNTRGPVSCRAGCAAASESGARAHYQYRLAWRDSSLADARALLHVKGRAAHADTDDVKSLCARDQRELRGSGNDCEWRSLCGVRAFCQEDSDAAQWQRAGSSSGGDVFRDRAALYYGTSSRGRRRAGALSGQDRRQSGFPSSRLRMRASWVSLSYPERTA